MIDKAHDKKPPKIDEGYKVFTDEELKRIKDSFPKHRTPVWKCPVCGSERILDARHTEP